MLARAGLGAALFGITLLMAGCVKPVERDDASMSASPEQVRRAPTQPAVRPQEAAVEKKRKSNATAKQPVEDPANTNPPVETSLEAAPDTTQPSGTEQPVYTAAELMGKRPAEVTALMGVPARVEQRAASTVWIYQDGDCGLDVFFFLDVATSDERVLTVAATAESEAAANAASEAAAANATASIEPSAGATEPQPSSTPGQASAQSANQGSTEPSTGAPATGAPAAEATATAAGTDATQSASPPPAASVVDVCYGKLRRS